MDRLQLGRLELHYNRFPIPGTDGLDLVISEAERGSRTAESLGLLASMSAEPSDGSGVVRWAVGSSDHPRLD
jgi:hypothetical protein